MKLLAIVIASALFVADRLTKAYFLVHTVERIDLIPSVLWLQYHLNDRMALSLPLFPVFYYTLVGAVIVALCAKLVGICHGMPLLQQNKRLELVIVSVLLAGAVSNLLDRLLYGGVVDFITVSLGSVFNLADVMIVGSVISWVIIVSYGDRKKTV